MLLEESGSSKDVPPLSNRGFIELSTFVQNRVVKLNENGLSYCKFIGRISYRSVRTEDSQEVPD
jgi:hypothetical protein